MTSSGLMSRLGLFLHRGFMPEDLCGALQRDLLARAGEAAEVFVGGHTRVLPDIRRTLEVSVAEALRAEVQARLHGIRPALSAHFHVALTASEGVGFLLYERGGFYRPHRDCARHDAAAGGNETVRRRVSVIVFLNGASETPAPAEYAGGHLHLYGLIDDPVWRDVGFPIDAEPGSLVAFDSATLHEVTPVVAGRRLTAVDWFY